MLACSKALAYAPIKLLPVTWSLDSSFDARLFAPKALVNIVLIRWLRLRELLSALVPLPAPAVGAATTSKPSATKTIGGRRLAQFFQPSSIWRKPWRYFGRRSLRRLVAGHVDVPEHFTFKQSLAPWRTLALAGEGQ